MQDSGIMNGFGSNTPNAMRFVYRLRLPPDFARYVFIGWLATLLTLLLLVQTNRRFGLTWRGILRAYIYSTAFASTTMFLSLVVEMIVDSSIKFLPQVNGFPMSVYNRVQLAVLLLGVPVTFAHLAIAYTRYLKVPRGWAAAALSVTLGAVVMISAVAIDQLRLFTQLV